MFHTAILTLFWSSHPFYFPLSFFFSFFWVALASNEPFISKQGKATSRGEPKPVKVEMWSVGAQEYKELVSNRKVQMEIIRELRRVNQEIANELRMVSEWLLFGFMIIFYRLQNTAHPQL